MPPIIMGDPPHSRGNAVNGNGVTTIPVNGGSDETFRENTNGNRRQIDESVRPHGHMPNGTSNGTVNGFYQGNLVTDSSSMLSSAPCEASNGGSSEKMMPIAIVGMSCRVSGGVSNPSQLWELCSRSRSGWSEIPKERFNLEAYHHPNPEKLGCFNPIGGHFLQGDISLFDAAFFNISAQEAASLDPQQRIMLESAFEALEDAGITKNEVAGQNIGCFVGGSSADYEVANLRDTDTTPPYLATGTHQCMLSNRLSYYLDLRGPSVTVDSACSSSLSALHVACQSLRSGESKAAIVGACHLNLTPDYFIAMSMSRLFSDTGITYSFDERSTSGFGRGEGAGCLILKPLQQAIEDRDKIRAVIAGTGMNQDGRTPGITQPSGHAQEELIRSVYKKAGLNLMDCGFVEAHGTGTKVGDPIEATALYNVLGKGRPDKKPLYIGSIKSNIGHCEGASGVISVIKATMMLERGFILPNINFENANPEIPLKKWNMKVPIDILRWPEAKRYISINNFGFGGTNAHCVLEQAPRTKLKAAPIAKPKKEFEWRLYVLSGAAEGAVKAQMKSLEVWLEQHPESFEISLMPNLAYTLGQRRTLFPWRVAIPAISAIDLNERLLAKAMAPIRSTNNPTLGFVFTGQGAQWHAMGRELLTSQPVFASAMAAADKCLKDLGATFSLLDELTKNKADSLVDDARISQPSCTAIQIAVTNLLQSWGICPAAVTGHSSGEIGAAYAAGVLNLEEAMTVAYYRGVSAVQLRKKCPEIKGAMLAVGAGAAEIAPLLKCLHHGKVTIACINSPSSITASGDAEAIKELAAIIEKKGLFNRQLKVDLAYHSHHMLHVAEEYRTAIAHIQPRVDKQVAFFSSLVGRQIDASELTTSYWVDNLTSPVQFSQSMQSLCSSTGLGSSGQETVSMLCEIGPHSALEGPVKQILKSMGKEASKIQYVPSLVRNKDATETALTLAATLLMNGQNLNFAAVNFAKADEKKPTLLSSLPSYPWQRTKHWTESRIQHNHRHKRFPRSDLIGTLAGDSNDLEPRWRNIVRADDLPWVRHHKMQDMIIWPMTGYLAMAVEAAKQRAIMREVKFDKFVVREFTIKRPLIIQDDVDVETMITLRPHAEGTRTLSDTWDEFRVFSWAQGKGWIEHCNGLIAAQETPKFNPINGERQFHDSRVSFEKWRKTIIDTCTTSVDPQIMYATLAESGVQYGETFQGMENIRACDNHGIADVRHPNTAACMPYEHEADYMFHPSLLDICLQSVWPIMGAGRQGIKQLYLPSFIKTFSISCKMAHMDPGELIRVHSSGSPHSAASKPVPFDVFATDIDNEDEVLLELEGVVLTPVYDKSVDAGNKAARELCYKILWDRSLESMKPGQVGKMLSLESSSSEERRKAQLAEQASFYYLETALAQIPAESHSSMPEHHRTFYAWMRDQVALGKKGKLKLQNTEWMVTGAIDRRKFLEAFKQTGAIGEMICTVGEKLPEILKGEIDPLAIMRQDALLDRYQHCIDSSSRGCAQAALYLDKLAYQNPSINILELGAGEGGATLKILETLGGGSSKRLPRFGRYLHTDISNDSSEKAKAKLSAWEGLVDFRKLDPERSPMVQGFEKERFDVVFAVNTLHDHTTSMAMHNLRGLLNPGGKLLVLEPTTESPSSFVRALLPDWKEQSEQRNLPGRWDKIFAETEFSGAEFVTEDDSESLEQNSLIIATANSSETTIDTEVAIITHETSPTFPISTLSSAIKSLTGKAPIISSLLETPETEGKICIFLGELTKPLLKELTAPLFQAVHRMLTTASGVLWVSRGAYLNSESPDANMVNGLARTIRSETAVKFVTLDLDHRKDTSSVPPTIDAVFLNREDLEKWTRSRSAEAYSIEETIIESDAAKIIVEVFKTSFASDSRTEVDMEYLERSGQLLIPRVVEDEVMNTFVHQETKESEPYLQKFVQKGRPLRMTIESCGSLDTLYFADDLTATEPLPDDHVEIEVRASALNFKDIMISMGQLPNETVIGIECSGVVTAIGSKVSQVMDLAVGDRVATAASGTFANLTRCKATNTCRIPDNMSFEDAASIPVVFGTAYYALYDLARLGQGETVLIHAAAGGVGQAAIILSQMIGATIYTTVGSVEKKEFLMKQYNLPEESIFFSRDTSFGMDIKRATQGKGVDVVLNSLAGDFLETTWKCLAHFGRFIEIGKRDIVGNTRLEMAPFEYNATFASVDLTKVGLERPLLMKRLMSDVFGLFRNRRISPIAPVTVFPISDVERAFRLLQGGKTMGKVVVRASSDDQVKAVPPRTPTSLLKADATYVIVGGTGGIGRSITKWMVQKGARHIVLISRSGNSRKNVKDLIRELGDMGATVVAHKCDVGSKSDVDEMLEKTSKTMPPVRGVIHGAMVLNDVLFEKMTFQNWEEVVRPKVAGAWNLHNSLIREPLDFFISLSSVAGIVGNRGQAAYAAAGTFLDAFAQYRISKGLPCTSIDLTAVENVGYLAENKEKKALVTSNLGGQVIVESEILALMAAAIGGKMTSCNNHCITGAKLDAKAPDSFWANDAKFSHLRRALAMEKEDTAVNAPTISIGTAIKQASSDEEGVKIVYTGLVAKVSAVLLIPADSIDPTHSVASYGLDSLAAIEVRNWITRELEANLQVLELLTSGSMLALAEMIVKKSKLVAGKVKIKEKVDE